jgi:hypothetical protein
MLFKWYAWMPVGTEWQSLLWTSEYYLNL